MTISQNKSGLEGGREEHWAVEFLEEFFEEYSNWSEAVQDAVLGALAKLRLFGPSLGRPAVDKLKGSDFSNLKELRVDADGGVWRIAFAFDPKRKAILLTGGNKASVSKDRFYSTLIRVADARYVRYLKTMDAKGRTK